MNKDQQEEAQETKLVEMVKEHGERKRQLEEMKRQRSGSRGTSDNRKSGEAQTVSTRTSRIESNMNKAVKQDEEMNDAALKRRQKLREIEDSQNDALDMKSAIKERRSKNTK